MSTIVTDRLYPIPSAAAGVNIVGTAGSWAAGAWSELAASADADWAIGHIVVTNDGNTWSNASFAVEIGIGTAGNEVVVAEFFIYGPNSGNPSLRYQPTVPLNVIPSGSRVAARLRNANTTYTVALAVYKNLTSTVPQSDKTFTYYPNQAVGVPITTSTTAWANSLYGVITSGLADDTVILGAVVTDQTASIDWELDIALGASGSEVVKTQIRGSNRSNITGDPKYYMLPAGLSVPANTRVATRIRRGTTTSATIAVSLLALEAADAPDVITLAASGVDFECATLQGTIDPNDITTSGYFIWGTDNPPTEHLTTLQFIGSGSSPIYFSEEVCGLDGNTTYYYRAVARTIDPALDYEGNIVSFSTSGSVAGYVRATQLVVEHLDETPEPDVRVTQLAIEHVSEPVPSLALVSQLAVEYVAGPLVETAPPILIPVPEGEDLCPSIDDPILFASWLIASGERYWFAECPLTHSSGYRGGWKEERILAASPVTRRLSSTNWDYNVASFSVDIADEDWTIREKITRSYWYKKEVETFYITPNTSKAEGAPHRIATGYITAEPSYDDYDQAMTVRLTCRDRVGMSMGWTETRQDTVPRRKITEVTLPGVIFTENYGKSAPYPFGHLTREVLVSGIRARGLVKAFYVGDRTLPDLNSYRTFMVAGCALKGNYTWYYDPAPDDPAAAGSVETNPSDFFFPGTAGWNSVFGNTDLYEDIVGSDGITRRWALAYGSGAKADLVASGIAMLSWDGDGIEASGTGLGAVVTDLHDQFALAYENLIAIDEGEGYTTGDWVRGRTFSSDVIPIFDYIANEQLKTMRADELEVSNRDEWEGAGILGAFGESIPVGEAMKQFAMCGDFRQAPNRFWQLTDQAINLNLTEDDVTPLLDKYDIHVRTFKPGARLDEFVTHFTYQYRRDYAVDGEWIQDENANNGVLQTRDEVAEANWGGERTLGNLQFQFMRDAVILNRLIFVIRKRKMNEPPMYIDLEGSICLTGPEFDVGKYVALDHWRGPQMSGWAGRPLWILENTPIPETRRVKLELLDLWPQLDRTEFP